MKSSVVELTVRRCLNMQTALLGLKTRMSRLPPAVCLCVQVMFKGQCVGGVVACVIGRRYSRSCGQP